ncbi:MAG: tetratricopeptide repeat protein [Anaerolineales bacterium]|nr:tetratricopeptide repeat protein [Anaerolineales bacterium]
MRKRWTVMLTILILALTACEPTQDEIDAHGTEVAGSIFETQTAQAKLATATPTLTPSATPTPTESPSDLLPRDQNFSLHALRLNDLPPGYALATEDVQNLLERGLPGFPYQVERIYGFRNESTTELVAGLHVLLPSEDERVELDQYLAEITRQLLSKFTVSDKIAFQDIEEIKGLAELGDAITGYTTVSQFGEDTFRFNIIGYRRGVIGLWISVTHLDGETSQVSLNGLIETIDSRITEPSENIDQYYGHTIQALTDAIESFPEDSNLYYLRGKAYYKRYEIASTVRDPSADSKDFEKAIEDFSTAIELNPRYASAYSYRGMAHAAMRHIEDALFDYGMAIAIDPSLSSTYYARALLFEERGDFELAIIDYKLFLELNTDPYWRNEAEIRLVALQESGTFCEPYQRTLVADAIYGGAGSETITFYGPRGVAVTTEGEIYVTDSLNHRIQHLSPEGELLHVWGHFASIQAGEAAGGTFNEPWGIGVSSDGVTVADTWNHRIQQFTANGEFIRMYGTFGTGETAFAFWGPRDVAVDSDGRVFVTDTGNKRIVVFDGDGKHLQTISPFGGSGVGQMDEPVGLALAKDGRVFVADTWNMRVQIFSREGKFLDQWPVSGWYGKSLTNKPYIALDDEGTVFVTDPEGFRIMAFSESGELLYCFGSPGTDASSFGLPIGVAYDHKGGLYVTDAENNRLMHFVLEE